MGESYFLQRRPDPNRGSRRHKKLVQKYYEYAELVGDQEYFSVAELSAQTKETEDEVRRNILDMRAEGLLPYAAMDKDKTTVMLSDRMVQEYIRSEQKRSVSDEEERIERIKNGTQQKGKAESWDNVSRDIAKAQQSAERLKSSQDKAKKEKDEGHTQSAGVIEEGEEYIRTIRRINKQIPEEHEMTKKLNRLEDTMTKIFDKVEKEPEKAKDIRRLMNYYLPTTIKLLNSYVELSEQKEAGENIKSTKRQIEEAMDTINTAFDSLLDDLYQDQAWDISSDIHVMKTMMTQDGLVENTPEKK